MEMLLNTALKTFKIVPKGVIHIGASSGQEGPMYKSHNIQNILWIEADPDIAKALENTIISQQEKSIRVANFAASDRNGVATLIRTNNQQASSILEINDHLPIYPDIKPIGKVEVKLQRLDDYFKNIDNKTSYNILVLDIQGVELLALKGSIDTLKQIDCIITEVYYDELYKKCSLIHELDSFLLQQGFLRTDTLSVTHIWGDALYIRKEFSQLSWPASSNDSGLDPI